MKLPFLLLLVSSAADAVASTIVPYTIDADQAAAGEPFDGFVSYSIEFSSFPDFAGNKSQPNVYSNNLLENIGDLIGTKPYIRVGGNTQDYALYNASLPFALNGTYNLNKSPDYPTTIFIGPSYFESYSTWNATKFSHGFNLGLGGNNSEGWQTLLDTAPLACKALSHDNFYLWEYGNEPDLYSTSAQGPVRPSNWNETTYVSQWLNGTRHILERIQQHCPELAAKASYGYMAPSLAGTNGHLKAIVAWQDGLNTDKDIKMFSTHNYISGATSPGVTLQGTLMNHGTTMRSVNSHITEYNNVKAIDPSVPPLIMGETNSLYNQGKPGLSNSFGAALWGVDFNLYCASVGIKRVHMHMGTNYRYASWQPIETDKASLGTKAPYYGNIAVAAMMGDLTASSTSIIHIPLDSDREAAYAAYVGETGSDKTLARILVINFNGYNTTVNGAGEVSLPDDQILPRQSKNYTFAVSGISAGTRSLIQRRAGVPRPKKIAVQRLWANGSDAITGITWDGWSYNYELDNGRPVRLHNVTVGETVTLGCNGQVTVNVPDSSAVLLNLAPGGK
ncbi:hypothetical protein VTK73DRAFT_5294 [Phialemonium thermophilum]|uniref:Beta-glucuronidase C-terminal domain-containing protein n=1 Tax=Phialemonium thermophilum TaxID=223376 RepID=A0ABR3WNQ2_9PEZI